MGFQINDADITAFTAIIQVGAIAAAVIYFWDDLIGILRRSSGGSPSPRPATTRDFRFGLAVALGSIPIGIVGFVFRDQIESDLRNLWVVGIALILWSLVMYAATCPPRRTIRGGLQAPRRWSSAWSSASR